MSLSITKTASQKAVEVRARLGHPSDWLLHIGLQGGGCSGFKYQVGFIEPPKDESDYYIIENDLLRVACDKKSFIFLVGTEVDYEETIMSSGFVFNTPLASRTCGCGESVGS